MAKNPFLNKFLSDQKIFNLLITVKINMMVEIYLLITKNINILF